MKIRNGFVSNSSSSSFIVAFNPNYNMEKKGKKLVKKDKFGDSPFQEIIKLYGQEEYIYDNSDILLGRLCESLGLETIDELPDADLVSKIQHLSCSIPDDWKWAEVGAGEGTISRLGQMIIGIADVDLAHNGTDELLDYDFSTGYMIRIN